MLDAEGLGDAARARVLDAFDRVTSVLQAVPAPPATGGVMDERERRAHELARQRAEHRKNREWTRADEVRNQLLALGFDVRDTKDGGYELRHEH